MTQQALIKLALIGECMAEITQASAAETSLNNEKSIRLGYGGDVMNTAIYTKRIMQDAAQISFVSVMGKDRLSRDMMAAWHNEGIHLSSCPTIDNKTVGLYMVHNRADGERKFQYWRSDSAAKYLMQVQQSADIFERLEQYTAVYLSGISIAILPEPDRQLMLDSLKKLKATGVKIIFDSNYRPLLWGSIEHTKICFKALYALSDLLLVTFEDEQSVWDDKDTQTMIARLSKGTPAEIVVKLGAEGCDYYSNKNESDAIEHIPTQLVERVIDTTAAGDSFNAGFLAAWLNQKPASKCATLGNLIAGQVIQQKGAIVPLDMNPIRRTMKLMASA